MKRIRCAIYTRKSSEEGLELEFNSLDAQREACEAYITSQKAEGWVLLPEHYDDGGISGGTMKRPALQRLLKDIDRGTVDQILVYKIDRLTRSLADFSKIVDRLDAADTSFVSVTQSFNTATSMGRLTLNMLLSFAQFEREVTAERIRDKIAASKKKGLWMGGKTHAVLLMMAGRVDIAPGQIEITLIPDRLTAALKVEPERISEENLNITSEFQHRKRGVETKLILADGACTRAETLFRNIALAHRYFEMIRKGKTYGEISEAEGASKRRVQLLVEPAFLAPDVIRDVWEGSQSVGLTSEWVKSHSIPPIWKDQRELFKAL